MDRSVVLGCQLRKTELMVDPKELILPKRHVEEAFFRRPTVKRNILSGEVMETVTTSVNQNNDLGKII
jgi:hypothetical protein